MSADDSIHPTVIRRRLPHLNSVREVLLLSINDYVHVLKLKGLKSYLIDILIPEEIEQEKLLAAAKYLSLSIGFESA